MPAKNNPPRLCSFQDCARKHSSHGFCKTHALQATRGRATAQIRAKQTDVDRFWSKVNKNGPTQPHMDSPCWEWTGGRNSTNRGTIKLGSKNIGAHRVASAMRATTRCAFGLTTSGSATRRRTMPTATGRAAPPEIRARPTACEGTPKRSHEARRERGPSSRMTMCATSEGDTHRVACRGPRSPASTASACPPRGPREQADAGRMSLR